MYSFKIVLRLCLIILTSQFQEHMLQIHNPKTCRLDF